MSDVDENIQDPTAEEGNETPGTVATTTMASNFGKVKEYDASRETWSNYVERLEFFFIANGINDATIKRAILLSASGPETYNLCRSLCSPELPSTKTYDELKTLIEEQLNPTPNPIAERFKFYTRNRQNNESIAQYVAALRKLARYCGFTDVNEQIRDRLVCGVNHKRTQQRLLSEGPTLTFTRAKEVALAIESSERDSSNMNQGATSQESDVSSVEKSNCMINKIAPDKSRNSSQGNSKECFRCGKSSHSPEECKFKEEKCFFCSAKGHTSHVCRKKMKSHKTNPSNNGNQRRSNYEVKQLMGGDNSSESGEEIYNIFAMKCKKIPPIIVNMMVNNKSIPMEIDTGASLTIMSKNTYDEYSRGEENEWLMKSVSGKLRTYTKEILTPCGVVEVSVKHNNEHFKLPIVILPNDGPTLLGRNWLDKVRLDWKNIFPVHRVETTESSNDTSIKLAKILDKYKEVFEEKLGTIKDTCAHIELKEDAKPQFYKARPVAYALRDRIDSELDRLISNDVLRPTEHSEWATPIVPLVKPNGEIRICGNYKLTVNKEAKCNIHPLPTTEDVFSTLSGGEKFTKLDLAHAYQQIPLDAESRKLCTINTHRGLFEVTRLQFGIHSASGIFQRTIEQLVKDVPRTKPRSDDVLITGENDEEHLQYIEQTLKIFQERGVRLRKEKCVFMAPEVTFLGYRVNKEGVTTVDEKIKPITDAPLPSNVTQLKSFLGMLNYYHKHLPGLATILEPLHRLLKKNSRWKWGEDQQNSFEKAKELLCSTEILVHYDPKKKLVIHCDASPYGIGAVLSHVMEDQTEKPIAYMSRTLNPAERNYSQIEREALAIIGGIKKFHQYVYGRTFDLVTDHKPLLGLLAGHKAIPSMCTPRIQRWAILLAAYDYNLFYRKGQENGNADCLSRLPLSTIQPISRAARPDSIFDMDYVLMMDLSHAPVTFDEVRSKSSKDPIINKVMDMVLNSENDWCHEKAPEFKPYSTRVRDLSVEEGTLLWGHRVVTPPELQDIVLEELHQAHPGSVRMKALARSYLWWPGIDDEIERTSKLCTTCQEHANNPEKAPPHPWEHPSKPWSRLHIDYAGPYLGRMFLIITDSFSKWTDVYSVKSAKSRVTIEKLRTSFASHGIPEIVVSDNASCFTSDEFDNFTGKNNIRHITGAPYHPSTNGLAERSVQTFKNSLAKMLESNTNNDSIETIINRFLFTYRITPHTTTGSSPAELLMGRKLSNAFSELKPNVGRRTRIKNELASQASGTARQLNVNDCVWVRNYARGPKWMRGIVIEKKGPLSYDIDVDGSAVKRHIDQLRTRVNDGNRRDIDVPINETPVVSTTETPMIDSTRVDNDIPPVVYERIETRTSADNAPVRIEETSPVQTSHQPPSPPTLPPTPVTRRSSRTRISTKFYGVND